MTRHAWPEDTADRIKAMRADGATWRDIGNSFGLSHTTVYVKAVKLGIANRSARRRFTREEDAILRIDYLAHIDIHETAEKLGRTVGSLRQRIFHFHKDHLLRFRSGNGTRAIRRYGRQILDLGTTADDGARVFRRKIAEAKAAARRAAIEAKEHRLNMILDAMLAEIVNGKPRDEAIFDAHAAGVTASRIAYCFGLSRERVRQICEQEAIIRAAELARHVKAAPAMEAA